MRLHRGCVTDPLVKAWWHEWSRGDRERPFAEYVAARWQSISPATVNVILTQADPWMPATCGHQHPLGVSCSTLAGEA